MRKIRILSWNVSGLRAVYKKGFLEWFLKKRPDILCVQEIRSSEQQLPYDLKEIEGYNSYFNSGERSGYSGVALYTKVKPENIEQGLGIERFDKEGRIFIAEYRSFILFNVYFPNGRSSRERLSYKMEFYDSFLGYLNHISANGKKIIICGDLNTAHKEMDLARPKENEKFSGFLPEERAWIDTFLSHGYVDTFRMFNKEPGHYTWWDPKNRARERNVGWRIDYFFVSETLRNNVISSYIISNVRGSDHCPVGIDIIVSD
ncbi:MAG: exodeoxyribonuclease III [Thermodesulfobacteriota bacterium]|nr:exodeoxyribonuclease III [Thermodesulfobacteriota bacterium]